MNTIVKYIIGHVQIPQNTPVEYAKKRLCQLFTL